MLVPLSLILLGAVPSTNSTASCCEGGSLSQQQCASMCVAPASRLFDCVSNKCVPAAVSGLPQALCAVRGELRAAGAIERLNDSGCHSATYPRRGESSIVDRMHMSPSYAYAHTNGWQA